MKHLVTCFLIVSGLSLSAQTPAADSKPTSNKRFSLSDYQLNVSFNAYKPELTDYQTLKLIAANAADLNLPTNIDSFSRRPDSQEGSQGTALVVLSASFSPYSKKKEGYNKQQLWRVGLSFRDVNTYESSYNFAQTITQDSSTSRDYLVNANQKVLGLETMYTFSTDVEKPVNVYVGLGLTAGYSISSNMEVNSNFNTIMKQPDGVNQTTFTPSSSIIKGKNAMYMGVFIPAGFHVRVKKNIGVLAEFRYGMYSTTISSGPKFSRNSVFAGIGLRYTLGVFEDKKPAY